MTEGAAGGCPARLKDLPLLIGPETTVWRATFPRMIQEKKTFPEPRQLPVVSVAERIVEVRGLRVILDADLAAVYGVETRALNQAVKRNERRFPGDFMFRLTPDEAAEVQRSRSQTVILKRGQNVKHQPLAFTEHGAIMAASVLNSERAAEMSVFVVRAFVQLRDFARTNVELAKQFAILERRVSGHDEALKQVFAAVRQLLRPSVKPRSPIGFRTEGRA